MYQVEVGPEFVKLGKGDVLQAGDQRYVDFSWLPVPKDRIGEALMRLHYVYRRPKTEMAPEVETIPKTYMGPQVSSEATVDLEPKKAPEAPSILEQDFQSMEDKIHATLGSLGLLHLLPKPFTPNKYTRTLRTLDGRMVPVDVYAVSGAFGLHSAIENEEAVDSVLHVRKKLLAPGMRGHKTAIQDLKEAYQSLGRAIEVLEGK